MMLDKYSESNSPLAKLSIGMRLVFSVAAACTSAALLGGVLGLFELQSNATVEARTNQLESSAGDVRASVNAAPRRQSTPITPALRECATKFGNTSPSHWDTECT